MPSWLKSYRYERLGVGSDEAQSWLRHNWQRGRIHVYYVFLLVVVAISSYQARLHRSQHEYYGVQPMSSTLRLTTAPQVFTLNVSFAVPPSKEGDAAWASLLPERGGFFTHPTLAPKKSCMAVFHQLHCLDMLRQTLYETRPGLTEHHGSRSVRRTDAPIDDNHEHSMWHIGHCFDLLRQTLMCRPDTTVEVGDEKIGGVTGFGTEHQCVNWQELMDWMKIYE